MRPGQGQPGAGKGHRAHTIPEFQAKPISSGVETLLASQKVSKDVRGRLQSHGVSGVQARHYDGHEYIDEKREGLDALYGSLDLGMTTDEMMIELRGPGPRE